MGATTTPGRMRVLSLAVVLGMVLAWAAGVAALTHRHRAVVMFGSESQPLVVTAQRIQTELDQADASAANAFLAGGIEPADQRTAYLQGINSAATDLADAARRVGTSGSGVDSVHTIAQQLPVYAGLVEQARAGNRQGFPVGAAYLRDASQLLRSQILPAAGALAQANAKRLNTSEGAATSYSDVLLVVLTGALVLAALALLQAFITRHTRRAVNVPLGAATVVTLVVLVLLLGGMGRERSAVVAADDRDYTATAELARARALAYQAQADESQALIAQGNGQSYLADLAAATQTGTALLMKAGGPVPAFTAWQQRHAAIASADAAGHHGDAVALALNTGASSARAAFAAFDAQVQAQLLRQEASFASRVGSARNHLANLTLIAALGMLVAALLALAGAQARINEYR